MKKIAAFAGVVGLAGLLTACAFGGERVMAPGPFSTPGVSAPAEDARIASL